MTITFRDAGTRDADVLDGIFRASFCGTFAHLYRPDDLEDFLSAFTSLAWEQELSDPAYAFHIGQNEGEAVGFVKVGPLRLPVEANGPAMELKQLYLLKEHHGLGIARLLMDWAVEEARRRGARQLYLTVYIDNHRARRLYEQNGFEPAGRYAFMVGSHADEDIIMRKAL
jgi:GNAT superfamily N-acetyltransferase